VLVLSLACLSGCGESESLVKRKLTAILDDDLASVVSELPASSISDSAFYRIRGYQTFGEGVFSALAVVDFHFLRGDIAVMVRKYRYHRRFGQWERYYNAYEYSSDSDSAAVHEPM